MLAVFWWLPLVLSSLVRGALGDLVLVMAWFVTNVAILLLVTAPLAALLGAFGSRLLLRGQEWGQKPRTARLTGVLYGAAAGALPPGAPWEAACHLLGNLLAVSGTGALLGLLVAARMGRLQLPRSASFC